MLPDAAFPRRPCGPATLLAGLVVLSLASLVVGFPVGGTQPVGSDPTPAGSLSGAPVPPTAAPLGAAPFTSSIVPSSNGSFAIAVPGMTLDLLCPSADPVFCPRVAEAVRSAATRLTSAVLIASTARIRVSFFKVCEFNRTCSAADTLAVTLPTRSFTVLIPENDDDVRDKRGNDPVPAEDDSSPLRGTLIEYPQLLLRELGSRQGLVSASAIQLDDKYDATLQLSATYDWYFPALNAKIRPDQFDLSMVVLHELVHAIGFGGINLLPAGNKMPMLLPVAELQTVKVRQESKGDDDRGSSASQEVEQLQVQRFRAPSVFESRLRLASRSSASNQDHDGPEYLVHLSQTIVQSVTNQVQLPAPIDAVSEALGAPPSSAAASGLFNVATTPNAILFDYSSSLLDGKIKTNALSQSLLIMESELSPPIPGSSLVHVSQSKYSSSPEFLMTFQIKRGKSLAELILANGALECGLGPLTLDALRSLGFRIQDKVAERAQLASGAPWPLPKTAIVLEGMSVANSDAQFTPLTPASGHQMPGGQKNGAAGTSTFAGKVLVVVMGVSALWLRHIVTG